MFGHSDNQQVSNPMMPTDPAATSDDQIMRNGSLEEPATVPGQQDTSGLGEIPAAPPTPQPTTDNPFALPTAPTPEPAGSTPLPTAPAAPTDGNDDLLNLKQKALEELSPLVGHLEQSPEEKFKTTMMMIQASDDQSLLPVAYEAAQAITDEKAKAQALLDVVNEINYFTQNQGS